MTTENFIYENLWNSACVFVENFQKTHISCVPKQLSRFDQMLGYDETGFQTILEQLKLVKRQTMFLITGISAFYQFEAAQLFSV